MTEHSYQIRTGRSEELAELREIEQAAAARFHDVGLPAVAAMEPRSLRLLRDFQQRGLLWVVADETSRPVGFALLDLIDRLPHLEEISVHPRHAGRGLGRRLIEALCDWARAQGYQALTLSTFRDVPWNAPFYTRLGFRPLSPVELTPGLADLRRHEAEAGLPSELRIVMRREL